MYNPFPGLRPFNADEAHLFFGRERHIAEIIRKLTTYRFVSIVGTSGSGKSSIVRAGLLPHLDNSDNDWEVCVMRPGESPIASLYNCIRDQVDQSNELSEKDQLNALREHQLGLVQLLRGTLENSDKRILILVDQFEELFRYKDVNEDDQVNEARQLVDLLLGAVGQKDVPIYVTITLRSDFLGDCEQFMGLPEAINDGQFLIPRMNKDEIALSITGPINEVGVKISPRLVQQLVKEVGNNPDQLPILQHVLMRTFDRWEGAGDLETPIDLPHYEETGGMQNALSNHAEEAYADLGDDDIKEQAEAVFKAITVKGPDNRGVRRPTSVKALTEITQGKESEVTRIANVFRRKDRGFLMPPEGVDLRKDSIIDISHESLMRVWKRLRNWVNEEAESADLYNRITGNALLYDDGKAGLWRDPDLQIAVEWQEEQNPNEAWANQYNPHFKTASRFIEASKNEKRYMLAEKYRRRRILRFAMIAVLVVLSSLSLWALSERNNAAESARTAIAEKQKADEQKQLAEEERSRAESNYLKAKEEEERALQQQIEKEKQREIALQKAEEAKNALLLAEEQSQAAVLAKNQAERERQVAIQQKSISDSLRDVSEESNKQATKLRLLALAQNLAIKSRMADESTMDPEIKALLALQAYKFNKENGGKESDAEVFTALYSAYMDFQDPKKMVHRYHRETVKSIAFDPARSDVASVGYDGKLLIANKYDLSKADYSNNEGLIFNNVLFVNEGQEVVVSCDDNNLYRFDRSNLKEKRRDIKGLHDDKIIAMVAVKDLVATASLDKTIRLIDLNTEKVVKEFAINSRPMSMTYSSAVGRLFVGCDDGSILILNPDSDAKATTFATVSNARVNSLDASADGRYLAAGSNTGPCPIYTISDGSLYTILQGHRTGITGVKFRPGSHHLATSCLDQKVRLYDYLDPDAPPVIFDEHSSWVQDVAFSNDGNFLSSCSKDKSVRIYPLNPENIIMFIEEKVGRNFTSKEWETYIGKDVDYEQSIN